METYKKLEKLCKQNPVAFDIAFRICFDVGAANIRKHFTIDDMPQSNLFAPHLTERIAETVTAIANAPTSVIIALLQRETLSIEGDDKNIPHLHYHGDEDGICPVCGAEINYLGDNAIDDDGTIVSWECPECGTSGKSGYASTFSRHYDVTDSSGESIPERED